MGELESENERVAQFAFQVNYLTSSRAKQPFPSGEGVASASEQRPGVTSWQRSNPFFLYPMPNCQKLPPLL